jgi:hypothetical protein
MSHQKIEEAYRSLLKGAVKRRHESLGGKRGHKLPYHMRHEARVEALREAQKRHGGKAWMWGLADEAGVVAVGPKKNFKPPTTIELGIGVAGEFTAESKPPYRVKKRWSMEDRISKHKGKVRLSIGDTLWRPSHVIKKLPAKGKLVAYDTGSFYQTNNDVTVALYRVQGYGYPVVMWFDNKTGRQIA